MGHVRFRIHSAAALLLVCSNYYAATEDDGCHHVPTIDTQDGVLQPNIGGHRTDQWTLFSTSQVKQHGLWCQLSEQDVNGVLNSNIGDWYYPTTDGYNTADNSTPYHSLKCSNQIGLVIDGNVTNYQGIVKCNTTVSNLKKHTNYFVVYKNSVYSGYNGPTVDETMNVTILSSRDKAQVDFSLTFDVTFGPPSRIDCSYDNERFYKEIRDDDDRLSREVIRSQYSSSQPDITRVIVTVGQPIRESRTYTCDVTVEGRMNVASGEYNYLQKGKKTSTVMITVAGTPTGVTVIRNGYNSVLVSWTAPAPAPAGYEVFHQTSAGSSSRLSGGNTSNTSLTVTGLTTKMTYYIFVVAFGTKGAPVLPSGPSNNATIMLSVLPTQLDGMSFNSSFSSIRVSWSSPNINPVSYNVSYSCRLLCELKKIYLSVLVNLTVTTYTISSLNNGSICTVNVTAVFSTNNNSNTITSSTNTSTAAPTAAPGELAYNSVESRSLSVVWGTVPCPHQGGPITGYRLRYSNGTSIVNITGEGSRQHVLTGLTPFTSYSVQVAAVNDGGTGPYSDPALTVETQQDASTAISKMILSTSSITSPTPPASLATQMSSMLSSVSLFSSPSLSAPASISPLLTMSTKSLHRTPTSSSVSSTLLTSPNSTMSSASSMSSAGLNTSNIPTLNSIAIVPVAVGVILAVLLFFSIMIIIAVVWFVIVKKRKSSSKFAVHYLKEGPKVDKTDKDESCYITLTNKPFIEEFPEDATAVEGNKLLLPVKIIGSPQPTLTWYHDNTRLGNDYAHEISSDGSLTIITVEMRHSGTY